MAPYLLSNSDISDKVLATSWAHRQCLFFWKAYIWCLTPSPHATIPCHPAEEELPVVFSVPWWCYLENVFGWCHGTWADGKHSMWWSRSCKRCTERPGGRSKAAHTSSTSGSPALSLGSVLEFGEPVRKSTGQNEQHGEQRWVLNGLPDDRASAGHSSLWQATSNFHYMLDFALVLWRKYLQQ